MFRALLKRIIGPLIQLFAKWYFKKPRAYRFKHIKGTVLPGVFYPHLTISTKLLMQFLESKTLHQKTFLELGCGTGLISVYAASKGAEVVASDINQKAVENAQLNSKSNDVELTAVQSDLFEKLVNQIFDMIVINPPYYPRNPANVEERAWYCGENFEYFNRLFGELNDHIHDQSTVYMILSEDCDLEHIQSIAQANNFYFKLELETKKWGEQNFIYSIEAL